MIHGLLERLARLIDRLSTLGGWIAAGAVAAIVVFVTVEILARTLLGKSTQISDELCGYLNVTILFLGMAMSLRDGANVRVEVFYDRLKGTAALLVRWLIVLASLAYTAIATAILIRYLAYSYNRGLVSTTIAQTPLWIPQTIMVAGSVLLVLQLAAFLLRGGRTVP
jgi:TRAP-type C4-dicarboxylate transport system permease small subunit